jgi:hypothetical protein
LRDLTVFDTNGEFQDVAADRIRCLNDGARIREFASVARIPEVIEEQFAKH